jgi:N-terminal half of MaoC dehydratase
VRLGCNAAHVSDSWVTDAMRALVGRTTNVFVSYPISASDIRKWAIAVYWPEPPPAEYLGEDVVAPEGFNPFAWRYAGPVAGRINNNDTIEPERILGVEPPPFKAAIAASIEVDYTGRAMRPGDVITATRSLGGYEEREGRLGLMLFTTRLERWENQLGEHVCTVRSATIRTR